MTHEVSSGDPDDIQKRLHPLEPVIHLVDEKKTKIHAIGYLAHYLPCRNNQLDADQCVHSFAALSLPMRSFIMADVVISSPARNVIRWTLRHGLHLPSTTLWPSHTLQYALNARRSVSMATASALESLGPMKKKDSMVFKMDKMFKTPGRHTSYLTSSRFALDLVKVTPGVVDIRILFL